MNVFEGILNGAILAEQWNEAMRALNRPPVTTEQIIGFNVWGFLIGIAVVWMYAALSPRFGAGTATGVKAGVVIWALVYVLGSVGLVVTGIFPLSLMAIGFVVGLVELIVAGVVGAKLYKQEASPLAQTAAAR